MRTLTEGSKVVIADLDGSVEELWDEVALATGIRPTYQVLQYAGKVLEPLRTLRQQGLSRDCTVELTVRLAGGACGELTYSSLLESNNALQAAEAMDEGEAGGAAEPVAHEACGLLLHLSKKSKTGYKGVTYLPHISGSNPYRAESGSKRDRPTARGRYIGVYRTAVEAAVAYARDYERVQQTHYLANLRACDHGRADTAAVAHLQPSLDAEAAGYSRVPAVCSALKAPLLHFPAAEAFPLDPALATGDAPSLTKAIPLDTILHQTPRVSCIFVRALDGHSKVILVDLDGSAGELTEAVTLATGVRPEQQVLQYAGKILDPQRTLRQQGLSKDSTVELTVRLVGGTGSCSTQPSIKPEPAESGPSPHPYNTRGKGRPSTPEEGLFLEEEEGLEPAALPDSTEKPPALPDAAPQPDLDSILREYGRVAEKERRRQAERISELSGEMTQRHIESQEQTQALHAGLASFMGEMKSLQMGQAEDLKREVGAIHVSVEEQRMHVLASRRLQDRRARRAVDGG